MRILVTGSSGHLGEALMRVLRSGGVNALGVDMQAAPFTDRVGSIVERAFVRERGWRLLPHIDRIHVNERARSELKWQPKYDFRYVLDSLRAGRDPRSPLACEVGSKGYHAQ